MSGKLRRQDVLPIVEAIIRGYRPEKVILFGALAAGEGAESRDVDLLVIKETTHDAWSRTEEVDRLISHSVPVDLLVYTPSEIQERLDMNDFFVKDILEHGVVLHEA